MIKGCDNCVHYKMCKTCIKSSRLTNWREKIVCPKCGSTDVYINYTKKEDFLANVEGQERKYLSVVCSDCSHWWKED